MNLHKYWPICTLLLFCIVQAKTFNGRVVNSETEIGLAGVSVTLLNSNIKTTTDKDGLFSLTGQVSVNFDQHRLTKPIFVQWNSVSKSFDLSAAPQVKSISLYNLSGSRLFHKEKVIQTSIIPLPEIPSNIYLMCITTNNDTRYFSKWIYGCNRVSFQLNTKESLYKESAAGPTLLFEKQGFQKKQTTISEDESESIFVKMKPEIGFYIFDEDTVRTYRLYLTAENITTLLDYGKLVTGHTVNTVIVPARLQFEGRTMDSVAVRFRGDQSLWDCISNGKRKTNHSLPQFGFGNGDICAKFSMKFDFNKYKKDQRLYGLKALNFRSMSADPTKMHEKLGYSLFKDMGIPTPRGSYAKLYVNDSLWGLFGIVEEIDGRFTKTNYPETGDGNLYKEIWPEKPATDAKILDALTTNNDSGEVNDVSDFKAFRDTVISTGTDSSNFIQKVGKLADIPYLIRYMVADRGIMNFDGVISAYVTSGGHMRHNYFWYHDEESGLFKLIPWDFDKVLLYPEPNFWTNNQQTGKNNVPNWNVVNSTYKNITCYFDPGSYGNSYSTEPIDKDKFLRLLRNTTWEEFGKEGKSFLDKYLTEANVNERLGKWRTLIADAVGEDPTIDSTEWVKMVDSLSHTVPLLRKNLEMMIDTLIVLK